MMGGVLDEVSAQPDIWDSLAAQVEGRHWRPKLAPWVEIKVFEARGGREYAMIANGRDLIYYSLDADEVGLLALLDGTRTLGEVVVAQLEQAGELDPAAVVGLVRSLHSGGFLTDPYVDVNAALTKALEPSGVQARLAKFSKTLTVEWSGAERMTQWLYRHGLRHLFRPAGIAIATLVAVGGVASFIAFALTHGLGYETQSFGYGFALLFTLNLLLIFIHELGHASVLVHNKRRVKGSGFRIYFGTPAFFVDSSDGMMLERRRRIAFSCGGPYFELVASGIASIALLLWPAGLLAPTLYHFVFLNYYVLLLNLTPMLELDGYFILSDVIRVPDLRPRSLAFVRHDAWNKLRARERFSGPDVGLFLYGTVGVAFTIFCLFSAYWFWKRNFGGLLTTLWNAGPIGVAGLLLLVAFLAGPIIRGLIVLVRAFARRAGTWLQGVRFRAQRRWRIEAAGLLDELPLFDDLPVEVLNDIAGRVERVQVGPGVPVVRQGDRADAFYVIRTGTLDVVEEDADGTERVLQTLRDGESFGELGLVTGAHRNATVRARERAELFKIDKGTFDWLLTDRVALPEFAPTLHELAALRALPPFANLPSSELLRVHDQGSWQNVHPGDVVVEQGQAGDAFYAVADGRFEVDVDGLAVGSCEPGDYFGEIALLSDVPRTATVRSLTPARVFRLERAGFEQLLADAFRGRAGATSHRVDFQRE
jgi:putative peptide zinc metalloprotease protein